MNIRIDLTAKAGLIAGSNQQLLFLSEPGYDTAIVGVTSTAPVRVIYDVDRIIELLVADGMDEEEAEEFYSFNIEGAYMGEHTPVFVSVLRDWVEDITPS